MPKQYWFCVVGPVERADLPDGADFPMRRAIDLGFEALTGKDYENCWSGWGIDEETKERVLKASHPK